MFYRLRRHLAYRSFNRTVAAIRDTAPITADQSPWTFVSMVSKRDVTMYLVSIKAAFRRLGGGAVVAIVDADLPEDQRTLLRHHVRGIELVNLEDIDPSPCQRGGTWERVVYCLERAREGYVIQLDADAIACGGDLAEVQACIAEGRAFTLADGFDIVPMSEAGAYARSLQDNYIGTVFEAAFDRYRGADGLRYVRGSSGFTGFSKGGFPRAMIDEFHAEGERLVGAERWREWGTEQCASNFAVANSPGARVLPFPTYTSYHPGAARTGVKLYHFIGTWRFDNGFFASLCRAEIAALKRDAEAR